MSDEQRDHVVRVTCTDAQWKALKMLAIEREQELRTLVTVALETSPHTRTVFA